MEILNAENCLAGSLLIDPRCYDLVSGTVRGEDFASGLCRAVFQTVAALTVAGSAVDPVTVGERLRAQGIIRDNGPLAELMSLVPTCENCRIYAQQVADGSRRRRLLELAGKILGDTAASTDELLSAASAEIEHLCGEDRPGRYVTSSEALHGVFDSLRDREAGKKNVVSSGFRRLDQLLGGGFLKSGLYIVAARPGVGKTTLALCLAESIARKGGVLYVSLEMSAEQLTGKRLAAAAGIPAQRILMGRGLKDPEYEKLAAASAQLSQSGLTVATKAQTAAEIGVLSRSVQNLQAVVVDYLGLLTYTEKTRYEGITRISGDLKKLAMSLNVPVIALAQLNRAVEGRPDKKPVLADLRDSGAVEQDADGVLLLSRADYYDKTGASPAAPSLLEAELAKNRHGQTGICRFNAYLATSVISEA